MQIWESVYQANKDKFGPSSASKLAWAVVKKLYKQEDENWVLKARSVTASKEIEFKSERLVCRSISGEGNTNNYILEGYLVTEGLKKDGFYFTKDLINSFDKQIRDFPINFKGDLEHINTRMKMGKKVQDDLPTYDNFMKVIETKVDDKGLWGKIELNKYTDNFPLLWEQIKSGFYDAFSFEAFIDIASVENKVEDGKLVKYANKGRVNKFSLTQEPVDVDSKMTAAYEL